MMKVQACGAIYLDEVMDQSAETMDEYMKKFAVIPRWPSKVSLDLGTQLEATGSQLQRWQLSFQAHLEDFARRKGFVWPFSPVTTPQHQGKIKTDLCGKHLMKTALETTNLPSQSYSLSQQRLHISATVCPSQCKEGYLKINRTIS